MSEKIITKKNKAIGLCVEHVGRKRKANIFREIHPGSSANWSLLWASESFAEQLETRNKRGETPLLFACRHGKFDAARWLVGRGADVNATDPRGRTSLMLLGLLPAETPGLRSLVVLLLRAGAAWDARDLDGASALSAARERDHPVVDEILKREMNLRTKFRRNVVLVEELRRKKNDGKEEEENDE